MAVDPRKRQKELQRRKTRERAKKKALARRRSQGLTARIERADAAPILHCCTTELLWERGMSQVLISREMRNGNVAFGCFLLDMYCLGVKDAFGNVVPRSRYDWQMYAKMCEGHEIVELEPAAARKLIEGAVEYARDLGLPPHPDYAKAMPIFGSIDAGACTDEFVYGMDGKPHFIAGPHDGPARCRQIINTLTDRCGPDGFHYTMPLDAAGALPNGGRIVAIGDDGDDW